MNTSKFWVAFFFFNFLNFSSKLLPTRSSAGTAYLNLFCLKQELSLKPIINKQFIFYCEASNIIHKLLSI